MPRRASRVGRVLSSRHVGHLVQVLQLCSVVGPILLLNHILGTVHAKVWVCPSVGVVLLAQVLSRVVERKVYLAYGYLLATYMVMPALVHVPRR